MATPIFALQNLKVPSIPMLVLLTFLRVCEVAAKKKKGGGRSSKPKNDDDDYLEIPDSPKKDSTIVIALIAVSILLALAIGAFYIYCMHHKKHEYSETGNSKQHHNTGQAPAVSYGVPPNLGNVTHERPLHHNLSSYQEPGNAYSPPVQRLGGDAGQGARLPAGGRREVRQAGRRTRDGAPSGNRRARRDRPDGRHVERRREESRREESSSSAESLVLVENNDEEHPPADGHDPRPAGSR